MQITPTNEDARLKALNRPREERGTETKPLEPTQATTPASAVTETDEQPPTRETRRPLVERRGEDRRQGERRSNQGKALLDTRDGRERRARSRRAEDRQKLAESPDAPPVVGIDIKA